MIDFLLDTAAPGESGGGGADTGFGDTGGEMTSGVPREGVKELFEISPQAAKKFQAQGAAVKALWQEEKKYRQKDSKIAAIIIKFLQNPAHTHFFLLLARLVGRNVPSAFLLALLALIHKESADETILHLKATTSGFLFDSSPVTVNESEIKQFTADQEEKKYLPLLPVEIKNIIDSWATNVFKVGVLNPKKIAQSLLNPDGKIEEALFQLTAHILQEFLTMKRIKHEYRYLHLFSVGLMTGFLKVYLEILNREKTNNTPKKEQNEVNNE